MESIKTVVVAKEQSDLPEKVIAELAEEINDEKLKRVDEILGEEFKDKSKKEV